MIQVMKQFEIKKLDGRFSYADSFKYMLCYNRNMRVGEAPLLFSQHLEWFSNTYGWSMNIELWSEAKNWYHLKHLTVQSEPTPEHVNEHWSFCTRFRELRIYVASEAELEFFQLKHG